MERLKKALELARAERESNLRGLSVEPVPHAPVTIEAQVLEVPPPAAGAGAGANGQESTVVLPHSRTIEVDPELLRRNGVLPPDLVGPAGHAFKMLRTQVLQRLRSRGWNTLAVVSPTPDDGKTFTAINLAIAIAADTNHTTLLVDFDLRNPSVHKRFGIQPDIGVDQCLLGEALIPDVLVNPQGYRKLLLLPARDPVANSSDLLSSEHTRELIKEVKARYPNRIVLFDLPPVLGADDALAFAPQVDAALVVVGEERTRREDLLRCFEILHDVPVLGTVLNGSRTDASLAYAY
jgi:protein-tyrosine kinase